MRVAADQAQQWVDSASELLASNIPTGPIAHVYASRRAMACEFAVQYHQADEQLEEAVLAAFDVIEQVEDRLTIYREHSEVIDLNQRAAAEPVPVDQGLFKLLKLGEHLHAETDGAFDMTSGPLSQVWGFLKREGRVPSDEELAEALWRVDSTSVQLDDAELSVQFRDEGTEINFNSTGKGFALDLVARQLDEQGHTDYLWHGGGSSLLARGRNRSSQRECWSVGLKHPHDSKRRLAEFHLANRALATAGGATQFFEADGQRYSHIIDPRTGWPATGIYTATVLAPSAALADGLATAFFVMDIEAVEAYCQQHPEIGAVLVCPSSENRASESRVAENKGFLVRAFGMTDQDWQCEQPA